MINKKIGISLSWLTRTNSFDIWTQERIRFLIKNLFLKNNIFISDIFIQEYPKAIYILFNFFPINQTQYTQINALINLVKKILVLITKKNIIINYNISSNLYANIEIFIEWLNLKLYNQPTKTKKLLKQILKQYDTITK